MLNEEVKEFHFIKFKDLKCGANPHQSAGLYKDDRTLDWEIVKGLDLTYNNIIDASIALEAIAEFYDVNAICVSNLGNIDALALGTDLENAWDKIIDCDPTCYYRSTIALSRELNINLAKKLYTLPVKNILAPSFSKEALSELSKNKNLKLTKINTPLNQICSFNLEEIKLTPFGALIQQKDTKDFESENFKVATKKKPAQSELEDMIFAFKVAKHAKSCAVVVAKDLRTLSVVQGEPNKIKAFEIAINKVCDSLKNSVIATDGFISSTECIQMALQNRVSAIIQPAGALCDEEIIKTCDKYDISMVTTQIRHIKH